MPSGHGWSAAAAWPAAGAGPEAASTAALALPPDKSSAAARSSPGPANTHTARVLLATPLANAQPVTTNSREGSTVINEGKNNSISCFLCSNSQAHLMPSTPTLCHICDTYNNYMYIKLDSLGKF